MMNRAVPAAQAILRPLGNRPVKIVDGLFHCIRQGKAPAP